MEAQIMTLSQQLEDTRHELMTERINICFQVGSFWANVFEFNNSKADWEEWSPLEVFENIERLYLQIWEGRKPSLEQINKYSPKELKICPNGSIMGKADEDCDCPDCEERQENTCEKCDEYYSNGCITHDSGCALLCEECSIDKDGEPHCAVGDECEWCDTYREDNEDEFCKGCQKALTIKDKEYETSQDWYEGDGCGENCINCVNDFIKQLKENEKEND